jgi:hypothetical protein
MGVADRSAELRDGPRHVLAGRTRDRWIGVALLGSGVILSGLGSVVGKLAWPPRPGSSSPRGVGHRLAQGITKREDGFMPPTIVLVQGAFADSSNEDVETSCT